MKISDNTHYQNQYCELHTQGLTNKIIAKRMQISYSSVRSIGRTLNLIPNGGTGWGGFRHIDHAYREKKVVRSDGVIFKSGIEAAKITGVKPEGICKCCHFKRSTCGGYHWRFEEGM
jgi:hypothetical protein